MYPTAVPLPGFESVALPICHGCKQPVPILGQWAPTPSSVYLCRNCMLRYPPPDVFVEVDNNIGIGLAQGADAAPSRATYHSHAMVLDELRHGCMHTLDDVSDHDNLPCMIDDDLWMMNAYHVSGRGWQRDIMVNFARAQSCRRCRNRLQYVTSQRRQSATWIAHHRDGTNMAHTTSLPICAKCGQAHDRRTLSGDYVNYCQRCEDENAVESLWSNRGIFGGDDDESVLDRLEKAFPGLFERGVLPDLWFVLKATSGM